ncbi:MAG: exopolysaccharide biosynthesis protein [Rhodospirillales bacterium]|nr:exopolysaccharide biosynthesis protein [Rhodospirillales bacterium]
MKSYNENVNGLRGLCAFLIFLRHVWGMARLAGWWGDTSPLLSQLDVVFDSLQFAVDIFFIISGYLITGALQRAPSIHAFAVARILRIYPVFTVAHLVLFAVGPLIGYKIFVGTDVSEWIWLFVTNYLLLPGVFDLPLGQLNAWSLSYEAAFYLFAAAAFVVAMQLRPVLARSLIILTAALLCWHFPRAVFFVAGVVLHLFEAPASRLGGKRWISPLFLIGILFAVLQIGALSGSFGLFRIACAIGFAIGLLAFASVARGIGSTARLFGDRTLQYLGTISYSFYLWHAFVLAGMRQIIPLLLPGLAPIMLISIFGILGLAGSLLVAHLSYRFIEQSATDWLRRRLRGRPAVPSTA